ncbi:MAG: hypothetical protein IJ415_01080 [Clostridia bacterium]|nr:hypothetical protein [Clostridia bacterium]
MKVVYVIDCITDLNKKINLLTNRFGENIFYVVKADLVEIFKTYGFLPNAIYYKNLTEVIHSLLAKSDIDDVIMCYASLKFDYTLLNKFGNAIGDKTKIVSLMPNYNTFEQMCNSAYNVYVKSLFKVKDSLVSPKLQFIPSFFVEELLSSHLGNRLFEINPEFNKNISVEDKEINASMKIKSHSLKYDIISIIIALVITIGLLASIAYYKPNYLIILTCIILYVLDLTLTIIFHCKAKFDQRFLK